MDLGTSEKKYIMRHMGPHKSRVTWHTLIPCLLAPLRPESSEDVSGDGGGATL
jgi:hypothetical protein